MKFSPSEKLLLLTIVVLFAALVWQSAALRQSYRNERHLAGEVSRLKATP